jgi:hypothetical protein
MQYRLLERLDAITNPAYALQEARCYTRVRRLEFAGRDPQRISRQLSLVKGGRVFQHCVRPKLPNVVTNALDHNGRWEWFAKNLLRQLSTPGAHYVTARAESFAKFG